MPGVTRMGGPGLVAIIPLYLQEDGGQVLQVVGCIEVSDYLDLIIERRP